MTVGFDPATAVAAGARTAAYLDVARHGPVQRVDLAGVGEVWLVTGWAEARQAMNDPRLHKMPSAVGRVARQLVPDLATASGSHMLQADGEEHARLRRLVAAAFTYHRVQAMEPRIRELVEELLDAMAAGDPDVPVDLMECFAYPLPLTVIFETLGVPMEWREEIHRCFGVVFAANFAPPADFAAALTRLIALCRDVVTLRREQPGDDLLSALVAVRESGDRLSEDELTSMIVLLLAAGHETTSNLIGNGVRWLLTETGARAQLREDPARVVEELLRFDPPLQTTFPLRATCDVQLGDAQIATDDVVFVSLLAANRDKGHIAEPDRLELSRKPNPHVAFGHGVHHCLGATLARIESRVALVRLFHRFPDLRLAVEPDTLRMQPGLMFNGLTALPVLPGRASLVGELP
jgi:cytochrome P450